MDNIWKISENSWGRKCPKCNKDISYSNKYNLKRADENKSLCSSCKQVGDKNPFYGKGYLRVGKLHHNYGKRSLREGKIYSQKTLKIFNDGFIWFDEEKNGWFRKCPSCKKDVKSSSANHASDRIKCLCYSCVAKNRKYSVECREKMRISAIKRIQKNGSITAFNPKACQFIEDFGKKNNYSFQHALNGGEVWINGYSVDGYDKEKNIIFEYDEPTHEKPKQKIKDLYRIKNILNDDKVKQIIRYSEKFGKLYKSFPTYSEIL